MKKTSFFLKFFCKQPRDPTAISQTLKQKNMHTINVEKRIDNTSEQRTFH